MAQLLGLLQAPATQLVRLLNEPGSALARLIDAIGKKNGDTGADSPQLQPAAIRRLPRVKISPLPRAAIRRAAAD